MGGLDRLGLVKTSLIDFPKEVAAVVFTFGCNLACPYCHNPELVAGPPPKDMLPLDDVLRFLEKRKNVLGGVCITGGEPLLHTEILDLADRISRLGLKVKLDTNGTLPDLLKRTRVDYIAMDLKTVPGKYPLVGASPAQAAGVLESLEWIKASGIPHEIRTTVLEPFVELSDCAELSRILTGAGMVVLTQFKPGKTLDPALASAPATSAGLLEAMRDGMNRAGIPAAIRLSP